LVFSSSGVRAIEQILNGIWNPTGYMLARVLNILFPSEKNSFKFFELIPKIFLFAALITNEKKKMFVRRRLKIEAKILYFSFSIRAFCSF
jgi:hypothetical protein